MDDEQRHAYLKSAGVHVLVVRKEDYTISMSSGQGTQAADDLVLDIPMNVVAEAGDQYVVNIGLGTLRGSRIPAAARWAVNAVSWPTDTSSGSASWCLTA